MIEVELPDGNVVQFEPGTSPDVIKQALSSYGKPDPAATRRDLARAFTVGGQDALARDPSKGENPRDMSRTMQMLGGGQHAWDRAAYGLKGLFTDLSPAEKAQLEQGKAFVQEGSGWANAGELTGDVVATGGVAGRAYAGAKGLFGAARGPLRQALSRYGAAAAAGGAVGAAQPVMNGESRGGNAATGAAFGMAGQGLGDVISKGVRGLVNMSPAAQRLAEKVREKATLGQLAANDWLGRSVGKIEEAAASVPFLGGRVSRVREEGVNVWRDNLVDKVAPKGFKAPEGDADSRLASAYKEYKTRYKDALDGTQVNPSALFEQQLLKMTSDPRRGLTPEQADQVRKSVMGAYEARFAPTATGAPAGGSSPRAVSMRGDDAKSFESFLSDFARRYNKGQGPMDGTMGQLYSDLERAWTTSYRRQLGPSVRKNLNPLDSQYAKYKTVEQAAGAAGNISGNFTPAQLNMAVKSRTGTGRFGRGEGLLNQEAQDAKVLFADRLPNSGTADRAAMIKLGSGAAALIDPTTTASAAAAILGTTTKAGKNFMLGETAAQRLLRRLRADRLAQEDGSGLGIAASLGTDQEYQE